MRTSGLDLRRKILVVALLPTALLVAAFLVVFAAQRSRIAGDVEASMGRLAEEGLTRAARDLRTLCESAHRELWQQVPRSLRVARDQMERLGPLSFSRETVRWTAVNQLDRSAGEAVLPKLLLGGAWAGQNAEPARPSLLVDRVRELVGAEATLFQRMNERGDMLRVATTVPDGNGHRAIGTYIPAVDPDGKPNPVVSTVLRGETYRGRARVLDRWYLSGYEPIRDASGRIAGMLFIGLRQDSLEGIRAGVAASRIGETGTMYALGASGNQRGHYLIPPPGHADGEDAWDARDARGEAYVQALVRAAMEANGDTVRVSFSRPETGRAPRERVAAVAYFAPWDWVIVAEMDRDEAVAPLRVVQSSLAASAVTVVGVGLLLLLASIWAARKAASRLAAPLEAMAVAAERIAEGDVQQEVTYRSGDEVGRLAEAFRGTIRYLQEVARGAAALARGDLSTPLVLRSDRDELTRSVLSAQSELRRLVEETGALADAAVEGRLSERADPSRHQGDFREVVEGVNATLSTLVGHLDAMPAPAMIVSPEFDIRYMNQTGASLLGRTPQELVGTKCYDSYRKGDCRTARCACARAMTEDREVSSETDAHPEGLDLQILYSAVPLRDGAGRVVGALEVVTDQTAVRRAVDGPGGGEGDPGPECRPCLVR
ncbi:Cache 3/Cache 2 fusion domain-containing protein [Anaeromyxobacter terrae]|uniref:Cache 3/Cache 2 fusion domain-containing protein n=1 Tax=Anaeromyxobacter terrae TaxID=2925406 RepID=UPI001F593A6D|nr:Cache 3/Cache 2 fusion domain-containing protein [Anaeromyxobacter sp. SG22]